MNSSSIFNSAFLMALFASGVRQSIPLIYGSVGDTLSEKAGAIGICLEGEMLFGAFFSYLFALQTGSLWVGVLMGAVAGMLSSVIVAVWSVLLRQDQSIVGIMFNILALGFTNFLNRLIFGTSNANISVETFQPIAIPGLSKIPFVGDIFFNQDILTYLSVLLAVALYFVLKKTKLGLQLIAVGENPKAAQASGIRVFRFRFLSYLFCGFTTGIAGASLTLSSVGTFTESISAGRGFICLAIVILARWNPLTAVAAAFGFGSIQALQIRLQVLGSSLPYQFFVALPYLITILVLVLAGHNIQAPRELGIPFEKESR
jgi:simple sugar transport system permease protein